MPNHIGRGAEQCPRNMDLGGMAQQDPSGVVIEPQVLAEPVTIGAMVFQLTDDVTLQIKVRGADNIVRSVSLTLA